MNNRNELVKQWLDIHQKLENLLNEISEKLRIACFGGYIRGFYDKSSKDVYSHIKSKTNSDILSIKGLALASDEKLLEYLIIIEKRLYDYYDKMEMKKYKDRYQNTETRKNGYDIAFRFAKTARDDFKKVNGHVPLTYLVKYLGSTQKDNSKIIPHNEEPKLNEEIYDQNDSTREKLKKVNKQLSKKLFDMSISSEIIPDILRQRYVFYGVGKTQDQLIKARFGNQHKKSDRLFDMMSEIELAHHLNISVNMLSYLIRAKDYFIPIQELKERMRTFAINEAIDVYQKEHIRPIDYENETPQAKARQKKITTGQISIFDLK